MLAPKFDLIWIELLIACAYVVIGRLLLANPRTRQWHAAFALLNVAALYFLFFWRKDERFTWLFNSLFLAYLALISLLYVASRLWSGRSGYLPWLGFMMPFAALAAIRYVPITAIAHRYSASLYLILQRHPEFTPGWVFVGFSYIAFRTSYLVLEVRNGVVPHPGYWEYLGFAFFAPTISVGPISRYSRHRLAFEKKLAPTVPVGAALLRVLIGAVKFKFLGALLNQLTYSGLLLDGHPHPWIDLPIAVLAYYLYLFCNFSGFCDIAIGGAALMGVPVEENFASPFGARNLGEFWNRWHITLSHYMRDVVFSPLSKALVRTFGPRYANHSIAATILVVFLLIGIWHGVGWNYAAFGLAQGVGLVIHHYYDVALKKRLGKKGFAAYMRNPAIHAAAVALTFTFFAASLFLFANDGAAMRKIFAALRWH